MKLKTIKEISNLKNKRVLLRCDFNVPLKSKVPARGWSASGGKNLKSKVKVADGSKIDAVVPTIRELQKRGAIVTIISHLGRPNNKNRQKLTLFPVAQYLSKKLRQEVIFTEDCLNTDFAKASRKFKPGQVILLENLRFHVGEEKNSPVFAKKLARLADIYVNDAFAVSHRNHASVSAITKCLPSYAGLNLEQEVQTLTQVLDKTHGSPKAAKHPALAIIGGNKISTKISVIENLAKKVDLIIIGGALANNFIKAIGYEVGRSIINKNYLKSARELLNHKKIGKKIIIPFDVRVGGGIESPRKSTWRRLDQVKKDEYILDIGPRTQHLYSKLIRYAKVVIWNGPMGFYENKCFRKGSYAIARSIARSRAESIIGGGETVNILKRLRLIRKIDFVSTGGGAMLEFLAGKDLPGIKPLLK